MTTTLAPIDTDITINQLIVDPYSVYKRLRVEAPVLTVKSVGRTLLTKASDTKAVKDDRVRFSADDPNTPMKPAFRAHTLMRKDGEEHMRERMAMMPAYMPKTLQNHWAPLYEKLAAEYLDRLPRGETVDIMTALCGPVAARILAHILGIPDATDDEMQRWSQRLIDGAGNFGWRQDLFDLSDQANDEMDAHFDAMWDKHVANPDPSAFSVMINAKDPIPKSQMYANIKIAIGGGINEPRDALGTIIVGLLSDAEQLEEVKRQEAWSAAFEEGVRWVAPIQASSRRALEDIEIRGCLIPKGDTVMTIQASACHDEELYDEPEKYKVFRPENPHQAFGTGPHHCAGAHVARRTVGQIMLPMLFERFPNMKLAGDAPFRGFGFRGPISVPVTLN